MSKPETISDQAEPSPAIESEQPLQQQSEGVTSSSTQIELNGDEKDVEESVNGCDSTTEVNETLLDGDISQDSETTESNIEIKTELTQDSEENSLSPKSAENLLEKTSECSDESENATPKTSRELKSILALSKEAKLDTNISTNRRKTLDIIKSKSSTPKNSMKVTHFPVTAESELDNLTEKSEKKTATGKKRKNSLTESGVEGAAGNEESRRSLQGFSGDFVMLKKPNKDIFCWRCHHDSVQIACETCPRAYHLKCLKQTIVDMEHWPCPECVSILKAENTKTRSKAMKDMTLEHLCNLLKFAVKRMIQCSGSEPFIHPVDEKQFPEYRSYIIQPMTLTMLEKNIKENLYGSTTAFESDAKWIVHNSIIFNSYQSKLTTAAKTIVKICKQEMAEIENCASCYLNANTKKHTWFVEVCPKPHLLVWAKLKGFPYWPAKVMSISASGLADVRFFGAHDKAWVSCKDCFLYSVKDPNSGKQKRNDIIECVRELELYVDNLKKSYGKVVYAPFKTHLDPDNQMSQLQMFLPLFKTENSKNQETESDEKIEPEKEEVKAIEKNDNGTVESEQNCDIKKKTEIINVKKPQEVTMTRIDYSNSNISGGKPKLTARPIKAILIRKRHSTDNAENKLKFPRREITSGRTSLDINIKNENAKEKLFEKITPNSKLKITEQLIKKLQRDEAEEKSPIPMELDQKEEDSEPNKTESVSIKLVLDKTVEEEKQDEPVKIEKEKPKPTENKSVEKPIGSVTVDSDEGSRDEKDISLGEIDPANICNIIHSSLVTPVKKTLEKKRKLSDDEEDQSNSDEKSDSNNLFPPNKMVKLVPIENILKKKNEIVVLKERGIGENNTEISNNNNSNNKTETNETSSSTSKESAVKIKSELESEGEEENNDLQYMEAKRKYLSALNISEKQKVPIKPKPHEIRTRSKTEEKKSKSDNISRIIDDVASRSAESTPTSKPNENVKEIYIKSISKMQAPKHKARKSFPSPNYTKKTVVARKIVPKGAVESDLRLVDASTLQPITPPGNVMILPKLHYSKNPPPLRDLSCPPVLTLLPRGPAEPTVEGSQNYIPQNENELRRKNLSETSSNSSISAPSVIDVESPLNLDTELGALKDILPENVTKSVSDILCQPPPKLKPKPSLLSAAVDSGAPSTAGPVSSRVNSMAQKLGDYFRGLLVETISDIGQSNNPEATISSLKLAIEELNHKHAIELAEIRRNVSIVLKDIQKIVVEERERVVNETKASCEIETNRRVEEAKSKQWCTWCSKEAQFYCCWNTSYCDYPCQQKHWLKHMSKCTQTANPNQSASSTRTSGPPLVLTPTAAPKFATLFAKPQKVYLKRSNNQFKQSTASATGTGGGSGHITLVESAPGNFELLGNGSISVNGKILATTSVLEKIKSGNIVTVTAPSNSTNTMLTSGSTQKVSTVAKSTASSSDSEH